MPPTPRPTPAAAYAALSTAGGGGGGGSAGLCRSTAAESTSTQRSRDAAVGACPRAGWISMPPMVWLSNQYNHPAQRLTAKTSGARTADPSPAGRYCSSKPWAKSAGWPARTATRHDPHSRSEIVFCWTQSRCSAVISAAGALKSGLGAASSAVGASRRCSSWLWSSLTSNHHLPPSRVDQHVAVGMATERSETTQLKDLHRPELPEAGPLSKPAAPLVLQLFPFRRHFHFFNLSILVSAAAAAAAAATFTLRRHVSSTGPWNHWSWAFFRVRWHVVWMRGSPRAHTRNTIIVDCAGAQAAI